MGWCVLLDRLESGFLLFETPQGPVPVELSLWQRAYLLWTFRNFRRLSLPLLNSRQASLVRALAQKNAGHVFRSYDPSLVIGVIESFKFAPVVADTAASPKADLSPADEAARTEAVDMDKAPQVIGKIWSSAQPAWSKEPTDERQSEIAAQPLGAWLKTVRSRIDLIHFKGLGITSLKPKWRRPTWFKPGLPKVQMLSRQWTESEWPKIRLSKFSASQLATAAGVLLLCIGSVIAWHRMGAVAGSEAHTRPNQIESGAQVASQPLNVSELRPTPVVERSSGFVSSRPKTVETPESSSPASLSSSGTTAVEVVEPTGKTDALASITDHQLLVQNQTSVSAATPRENDIQATRPPLRSWYPDYSGIAARGVVVLTAEVDSEGAVRSVRVVRGNRALTAAAVHAVRQWRYAPYFENGKAVATETNIVISVFSDDAISMSFPPNIAAAE
jgi:TonB family protein